MVPFVLPAVLMVAEEASAPDFVQYILPELKAVMKLTDPIQVCMQSCTHGVGDAYIDRVRWRIDAARSNTSREHMFGVSFS